MNICKMCGQEGRYTVEHTLAHYSVHVKMLSMGCVCGEVAREEGDVKGRGEMSEIGVQVHNVRLTKINK